jgi:heme o synthase
MGVCRFLAGIRSIFAKLHAYWVLTKYKQSILLLITGWAGYNSSTGHLTTNWEILCSMLGSLYLAICGSTVLNMVIDRDIDNKMKRTAQRPLPSGVLSAREALAFGLILSAVGIGWSFLLDALYGWIVAAGLFIDVVVYSIWLKRRTPLSIIFGGLSGGMPILAGRVLGVGHIDLIGILLLLAVVLWIPIHILTFSIKYLKDYNYAGVPTFPSVYGEKTTRFIIIVSTILTSIDMIVAVHLIGMKGYYFAALFLSVLSLIGFTVICCFYPSPKRDTSLFKLASTFMFISMLLISIT